MERAAVKGLFSPSETRATIVRFSLLRLLPGVDDSAALMMARPSIGGRVKKAMAPEDDRIGVPIPAEYLEQVKGIMPDGVNISQMTRYALYRLQGWDHETSLENALDFGKRAAKKSAA
jgi:hypothetical protein